MRIDVIEKIAGTLFIPTLVGSGASISPLSFQLISGSETLVNSVSAQSSGNGSYYAMQLLPSSDAWYVSQFIAVINATTYTGRQLVRARAIEVD